VSLAPLHDGLVRPGEREAPPAVRALVREQPGKRGKNVKPRYKVYRCEDR
jgi:hypothetical protein